jgi:dTDP-4-amino-4,6-dideoxygalactose transaminase
MDDLAETERWVAETLSLPCFPELEEAEIDAVIEGILEWRP